MSGYLSAHLIPARASEMPGYIHIQETPRDTNFLLAPTEDWGYTLGSEGSHMTGMASQFLENSVAMPPACGLGNFTGINNRGSEASPLLEAEQNGSPSPKPFAPYTHPLGERQMDSQAKAPKQFARNGDKETEHSSQFTTDAVHDESFTELNVEDAHSPNYGYDEVLGPNYNEVAFEENFQVPYLAWDAKLRIALELEMEDSYYDIASTSFPEHILEDGRWLTDEDMYISMVLLAQQLLYSLGYARIRQNFTLATPKGDGLFAKHQKVLHHVHVQNHWILVRLDSAATPPVAVYDSLRSPGVLIGDADNLKRQAIAKAWQRPHQFLDMRYMPCCQQGDGHQCGIHVIANAVELAFGGDANVEYNQAKLRTHLVECLRNLQFTPFPKLDPGLPNAPIHFAIAKNILGNPTTTPPIPTPLLESDLDGKSDIGTDIYDHSETDSDPTYMPPTESDLSSTNTSASETEDDEQEQHLYNPLPVIQFDVPKLPNFADAFVLKPFDYCQIALQPRDRGSRNILVNGRIKVRKDKYKDVYLDWGAYHKSIRDLPIRFVFDLDSVRSNSSGLTLPIQDDMSIYPFPNRYATMTTNNKMTYNYLGKPWPLYKIPNFEFAVAGNLSMYHLHIFFPKLIHQKNGKWVNFLAQKYYEKWYDLAVLPTLKEVLPHDMWKNYPLNYATAAANARTGRALKFTGYKIPKLRVENFVKALHVRVHTSPAMTEFQSYFFHVHAKDLKLIMRSSVVDDPRKLLDECYQSFRWSDFDLDNFWVDLGMEFYNETVPGDIDTATTLLWSSHFVNEYFKTCKYTKISRYPWCQSTTAGGGAAYGRKSNPILFCQMYMTEKSIFYHHGPEGGVKAFSTSDLKNNATRFQSAAKQFEKGLSDSIAIYGARIEWVIRGMDFHDFVRIVDLEVMHFLHNSTPPFLVVPTGTIALYKSNVSKNIRDLAAELGTWPPRQAMIMAGFLTFLYKSLLSGNERHALVKALNINELRNRCNYAASNLINVDLHQIKLPNFHEVYEKVSERSKFQKTHGVKRNRPTELVVNEKHAGAATVSQQSDLTNATTIFRLFLEQIISIFPKPSVHMATDHPPPTTETFRYTEVFKWAKRPHFIQSHKATWRDRFEWFFPPLENAITFGRQSQGWIQLSYYTTYYEWIALNGDQGRSALYTLFKQMETLPNGSPQSALWKTRSVSGKSGTFVQFTRRPHRVHFDLSSKWLQQADDRTVSPRYLDCDDPAIDPLWNRASDIPKSIFQPSKHRDSPIGHKSEQNPAQKNPKLIHQILSASKSNVAIAHAPGKGSKKRVFRSVFVSDSE